MTSTRTKLIHAMRHALATDGYHGSGLAQLLTKADVPKGVLYHHFPGGKRDLAIATIDYEVKSLLAAMAVTDSSEPQAIQKIDDWFESAYLRLESAQFQLGCPLVGSAHNIQTEDDALRQSLATAFESIRACICAQLTGAGMEQSNAQNWAQVLVSTFEGGLMLARTARSGKPLRASLDLLLPLLATELAKSRTKKPL
jgi:TetR/AcrR family transcriptional regulator, lmrAB and yxaGH operons repressor